jgi:aminoglycoside phosphotransferase (APT) family kinase protein
VAEVEERSAELTAIRDTLPEAVAAGGDDPTTCAATPPSRPPVPRCWRRYRAGMAVPRLDAERWVARLNADTGVGLTVLSGAEHGESGGAAYVRWPDGRPGVLTVAPGPPDRLRRTGRILDLMRTAGIPVPRYDLVTAAGGHTVVVQERLSGRPARRITRGLVEAIDELSRRFVGLLADHPEVPNPDLHLRVGGRELFRHDSLARYDDRSRRLLARIRAVGATGGDRMAGDDVVHLDLTPGNILVDDAGRITGVVDWDGYNGLARGDRRFGLVTLRFDLAWGIALDPRYPAVDPDAVDRLDTLLDAIPPATLRRYWAHMSLRMVDWTIRQHGPSDVDHQLAFAATRLP